MYSNSLIWSEHVVSSPVWKVEQLALHHGIHGSFQELEL